MSNFDMPWDKSEKPEPVKVTPIRCGKPTKEEFEEAADALFEEIYNGKWRFNR